MRDRRGRRDPRPARRPRADGALRAGAARARARSSASAARSTSSRAARGSAARSPSGSPAAWRSGPTAGFYKRAQIARQRPGARRRRAVPRPRRADDLRRQPRPPRPALRGRPRLRRRRSRRTSTPGRLLPLRAVGARDPRLRRPRLRAAGARASACRARVLDIWLWNRGQAPEFKARPRTAAARSTTERRSAAGGVAARAPRAAARDLRPPAARGPAAAPSSASRALERRRAGRDSPQIASATGSGRWIQSASGPSGRRRRRGPGGRVADDGRVRRDVGDDDGVRADLRAVPDRDRARAASRPSRSSRCPRRSGGACPWRSRCRRA